MNTNQYIQDYLVSERQQQRLQEAAQSRKAMHATEHHYSTFRHVIARSGALLVALGTRMEHVEQHSTAFASHGKA